MKKGQKSTTNGYQNILCPFTNLFISQGSGFADGDYSHQGLRAIDVTNGDDKEAPYYAPFDLKAVTIYPEYGQTVWHSLKKVRFSDGTIDYATVLTVHDNTINFGVGYTEVQGVQIGNMGNAGNATGVHCHIEFAKGHQGLVQNSYGNWGLSNAVEFEDACFMDNTNIISGYANWRYLPKEQPKKEEPKQDTLKVEEQKKGDTKPIEIKEETKIEKQPIEEEKIEPVEIKITPIEEIETPIIETKKVEIKSPKKSVFKTILDLLIKIISKAGRKD